MGLARLSSVSLSLVFLEEKRTRAATFDIHLKVVTNEKIGGSGVTSTLGTWYGGVVMGVL